MYLKILSNSKKYLNEKLLKEEKIIQQLSRKNG